jgi:DNA modification methylase
LKNAIDWESFALDQIMPYARHARRHSRRAVEKLKKHIQRYGQVLPIVIDPNKVIIDGHAVWQAMRELDAGEIAAVVVANRTDAEIKALRIALNSIPADAAWDDERLREELEELVKLSFDLEFTGLDAVEIDHLLDVDVPKLNVTADVGQVPTPQGPAITEMDDVWICGRHRIGCGDARDQTFIDKVRDGRKADMCFSDPHYNVPISGFVSGKDRIHHGEFVQGAGELAKNEFIAFLVDALNACRESSRDAAFLFVCIDWRHVHELLEAGQTAELSLFNICVWAKTNAGMGSLYRSQHELICVFKTGLGQHVTNVELGRHGRSRSNVWMYRGVNTFGAGRDELLAAHPTVKPVLLIADAIRDVTKRGDAVLDTFLGSGSTLIAAEDTGRVCIGVELDPLYVDVSVRRWQERTSRDAIHAVTGELFSARCLPMTNGSKEKHDG